VPFPLPRGSYMNGVIESITIFGHCQSRIIGCAVNSYTAMWNPLKTKPPRKFRAEVNVPLHCNVFPFQSSPVSPRTDHAQLK